MYRMVKNGREVTVKAPGSRFFYPAREYRPLDPDRVVGVDTESFRVSGVLSTTHIPIQTALAGRLLEITPGDPPLPHLLGYLLETFGVAEKRPSRTRVRSPLIRAERKGYKDGRDGRRETVEPVILVWYNAEYDLGRLIAEEHAVLRAVAAGQEAVRLPVGAFELEIVHMNPTGSAPSFEWMVRAGGRVVRLIGRDMWGYWKSGLDAAARSLGIAGKVAVGDDDGELFERDWLDITEAEKEELRVYALHDAGATRLVYLATVELLLTIDPRVIRRDGTIPASAPGAAAKIAFAKAFDTLDGSSGDTDMERWARPPAWANQLGLSAYAGGRVFCRRPGVVTGLTVLDITSAYPDAMRWLPDPARSRYHRVRRGPYRQEDYRGSWGVLVISGEGLDPAYPALRVHDLTHKRLRYVYGRFEKLTATIPEIVIGVASGRLRVDRVHDGAVIEGSPETSFLRRYVLDVFHIKETAEKDSPLYLIAKLLLNSLYGKLIEVREVVRGVAGADAYYAVPNWEAWADGKFRAAVRLVYVAEGIPGLEEFRAVNRGRLLLRADQPPEIKLKDALEETTYSAGHFFLPLQAANVTGFVSAKLGLAAAVTGALQGDTDSIFTADIAGMGEYAAVMAAAGYPAPGEGLGSFSVDVAEASGVLVKTKMYSLVYSRGGVPAYKQAHHGIVHFMPPDQPAGATPQAKRAHRQRRLHELLRLLGEEGRARYDTKKTPVRLKVAVRRGLIPGVFYGQAREIAITKDPNQILQPSGYFEWIQLP